MTLVELVVVIALTGIVAAASVSLLRSAIQTFIYVPHQARVSQIGIDLLEAMIEGSWSTLCIGADEPLRGLRFVRELVRASPDHVRFLNREDIEYVLRWRPGQDDVIRRIPACPPGSRTETLPYYSAEGTMGGPVVVDGRDAGDGQGVVMFRYFDVETDGSETLLVPDGSPWTTFNGGTRTLADVGRIEVNAVVEIGSGAFDLAGGRIELVSSVALRVLEN